MGMRGTSVVWIYDTCESKCKAEGFVDLCLIPGFVFTSIVDTHNNFQERPFTSMGI